MEKRMLFNRLLSAEKLLDAQTAVTQFMAASNGAIAEIPVGARPNNRGTIEVATDPGRSVIERITNALDAMLELEHLTHNGKPDCRSPREAAQTWLNVNPRGLGMMTNKQRQDLARRTVVRHEDGEGKESRILTVIDSGIGLLPEEMGGTILSLNEGNKWQKHYLSGTFGQGGSSTFAFSRLVLIASRRHGSNKIGFTVVRFKDLPAAEFKSGHYVYVVEGQLPLIINADADCPLGAHGTLVRHFGYDLTNYASPYGEKSLYGAMNRLLFDPVAPVWFENKVEDWNRGIYGSRNRLNSGSEDAEGSKPIQLAYSMPMFSVDLGEHGQIGIEYWVLPAPEKDNTSPSAAYVDHRKPIVLTVNGQNQSELSALIIRKKAELPYLKSRLICHVDCDGLSSTAKRALFASTREQAKEGYILGRIESELVDALKSDDELSRLNREAKDKSLSEKDDETKRRLQKEVARMLNISGRAQVETPRSGQAGTGAGSGGGSSKRKKVEPLETREPPTYVRVLQNVEEPITLHAGQRKWIRIETDATSEYHDPAKPNETKFNFVVGDDLMLKGTTALRGGRMRIAVECGLSVPVGAEGTIRVELRRKNLATLSDEATYQVVQAPKPRDKPQRAPFPEFNITKVNGPEDPNWTYISDDDTNVRLHASNAQMDDGVLQIYYSAHFPKFEEEFRRLELREPHLAASFQRRYEVWLAVHALLMHEYEEHHDAPGADEATAAQFSQHERCRVAVVAAMVAAQEVKAGADASDADTE